MSETATREPTAQELEALSEFTEALAPIVTEANGLQVRTADEAKIATEFLAKVAKQKRSGEQARVALVKPLKDHAKWIDSQFKEAAVPLEEADGIVRGKVSAYQAEQDRLRAEQEAELRRVEERQRGEAEEQRRQEEARARAEREATARESVRQQQAMEAREKARERGLSDRQREIAQFAQGDLLRLAGSDCEEDAQDARLARAEIAARAKRAQEQKEAEEAQAREAKLRAEEEEIRHRPVATEPRLEVAPIEALKSESGGVSTRKRWVATVVDPSLVPVEFMDPNMGRINARMRELVSAAEVSGEPVGTIPGVRIERVSSLAVRAK